MGCTQEQLPDYGYYPSGKPNEYLVYDSQSDLRDSESVPLSVSIHDYFLREVKPHLGESWTDLDKTKSAMKSVLTSISTSTSRCVPLRK
ncbi:hypothetical protein [Pleomorphovibrio marinus]|uniref:hypothetical protein n=1 Tax=Pleomorphovibrio marinus TaxID=2164132 RepID=UPI0013005891|nr:hypothetical protein [Pleomorphovibrio marinus]